MRFENEYIGCSVKEILTEKLQFSKRAIASLKNRPDGILINGNHATVRAIISENDVLEINCEDINDSEKLVPSSTLPDVIYEDEGIIALNKPPFMPTHQSQGHFYDTLANSLAHYFALQNRPFVFRSVNRLDKNTSGIVLVAKDRLASSKLSKQMKENGIQKTYIAIIEGELPENKGEIKTYIRRREKSIILREVCEVCEDGKIATTQYEVLASKNGLSLVLATPVTGRTHQLRVHFAFQGAQILGDDLYGKPSKLINRHALHAYKLSFANPINDEKTELFAPLPPDMAIIIEEYFGKDFILNGRKN
ncbi:MAG: RluA family pseudouridine synthase [Clostridia bacterium]|nr:RluA family pseudouridine synthase [Clostridia bacterium]